LAQDEEPGSAGGAEEDWGLVDDAGIVFAEVQVFADIQAPLQRRNGEVVRTEPTRNEPGLIWYECLSCGYVTSVPMGPNSEKTIGSAGGVMRPRPDAPRAAL
jgi:hypothetical protein